MSVAIAIVCGALCGWSFVAAFRREREREQYLRDEWRPNRLLLRQQDRTIRLIRG